MLLKEFKAVFKTSHAEQLEDLGLPSDSETQILPVCIDTERIESFFPASDNDEEATNVVMCTGETWTLIIKYETLKSLMGV